MPSSPPLDNDFVRQLLLGRWIEPPRRRVRMGRPSYRMSVLRDQPAPPRVVSRSTGVTERQVSKPPILLSRFTDQQGLQAAYGTDENVVTHGDTLYVSGTKHADSLLDIAGGGSFVEHLIAGDLQDVWDDLKIPFGLTSKAQRYQEAEAALLANPAIKNVTGHSLGGSVALELAKNHPERELVTRTYGAPVSTLADDQGERFRHPGDPVSMFDFGAQEAPAPDWNPHSYEGFDIPATQSTAPA